MAYPSLSYARTAYLFRLYLEKSMWAGPTHARYARLLNFKGDPKGTISKMKRLMFI